MRLRPRTPPALAEELAARAAALPCPARVLLDGVGSGALADALVDPLARAGRLGLRVSAGDFLRPAGERFELGREDADALRSRWLDRDALRREVLSSSDTWLPALWDAERDRSARQNRRPLSPRAVLLVDGVFLLGAGLPADLTVHVALSSAALRRRQVPEWQLPAFAAYDREVRPGDGCDVLVRAEDPSRPAVAVRAATDDV